MSIVLEQLGKRYDERAVVHGVSLEIPEGELFVLLGPSGSGKSTLLRMIAGLASVDTGRVLLHGRDVTNVAPQRRGIGFVFQHYALFQHMTAAENIEFGLRIRHVSAQDRRKRRDELLELVGLAGLGERLPRQLSGGQQQRVALARALAPQPAVLALDEPFGALDARIRIEMRSSLRQIQRELHITTIFVTHDQEEAFELGDRLGVMNAGRLLEVGRPQELYLRPQTEFVATFLGSGNLLLGTATTNGVALGKTLFPLGTQASVNGSARGVRVLFRPEDIALAATQDEVTGTALGQATVDQVTFVGTYERLLLRLPLIPGVRSIAPPMPFGGNAVPIVATRPQDQVRRFPLAPGDQAWAGVLRAHMLLHPGMRYLIALDTSRAGMTALTLGADMARLAHARVTVLGAGLDASHLRAHLHDEQQRLAELPTLETRTSTEPLATAVVAEAEHEPYDLVLLGAGLRDQTALIEQVLRAGAHHLLLVPQGHGALPANALVCLAGGEASKTDVEFVARLFRHLGVEATLLSVLGEHGHEDDPLGRDRAERFLNAGQRTLAALNVPVRTLVQTGPLHPTIHAEMARGGYGMLVLGAPLRPVGAARIRPLIENITDYPVLIVQSPYAAAGLPADARGPRVVEDTI